jgi:pyruvate/2-oxoglutarate dehydrogenase complex dihydrolipoamide dehydrogenase (E3) component
MEEFDIIVIGGGTAGVAAAQSAVEQGARVGLVESNRPGGHSLFRGQLPFQIMRNRMGKPGEHMSFESLVQEVDKQAGEISKEIEERLKSSGVDFIKGEGALAGNCQVSVCQDEGSSLIKSGKIVIATGSLPKPVGKIPFDDQSIFHIDRLLDWKGAPTSLLIVGGDQSGLEAGYLFNLLGTKVFLVDENYRLIHNRDPDLIAALEAGFKQQKIKTLLGKKIISIFKDAEKIDVTLDGGVKFSTERVLVSGERSGNTAQLGLDSLDIKQGSSQEIWVNETMETSLKGVFAVGSVTGRPHSLQISKEEGRVAGVNAAGGSETIDQDQIPFCLQTQPEIASIGCLSGDAHYKGYRAVQGRYDFSGEEGSNSHGGGFCKIIADRESKQFIGAQMLGAQASEAIAQLQSDIREGVPVKKLTQISEATAFVEPIISAAKECVRALSARR